MQVKQESPATNSLSAEQSFQHLSCSVAQEVGVSSHDMQCLSATSGGQSAQADKNSTYSLWAEYFDNFPIVTEFDLRSGATTGGSTGSSIASSSSANSENWSSPGSGSPFSDCEQEEPAFLDDHSVPNSVIDEIVQTLKMDGYNFDHLGEGIMENANSFSVKQEHEGVNQTCFTQPTYACLNPPKLELHGDSSKKYNANQANVMHSNSLTATNSNSACIGNVHNPGGFDQSPDGKWLSNVGALPSMMTFTGISLQQVQQHTTHVHQQHLTHSGQTQQIQLAHPASHDLHQQTYASTPSVQGSPVVPPQYSTPLFPGSYTPLPTNNSDAINNNTNQQYKYMPASPVRLQPPPLTCEKPAEVKPRRRRSTNSSLRAEKPHVCGECGAAFKLSANLKQHQVIHTGEKPFSCDICKAMFTRLSSLKTHHRLHTGEKPHICPYCSAAFADRSAMKAHKRIHTGERPYKCGVCQTSFTQLSHLNAHKRTHTGEKPYACVVCGTTFKQLGHLKRHEKSHVCSRM